ncbi:hypothetical protein R4Z10_08520 [Niallia sp. XMNu-256]|uniref:hypothetical protein n=1 Tax=Niallia sp. XMNu-256 TaxID=3082444 RepID=UPI0030D0F43E
MGAKVWTAIVAFFTNSWIVSIITGLFVYVVTKCWESFRNKRQYMQSVQLANKEVFDTFKLCVTEDNLPDMYIFWALHISTAKKFGVKQEDMDSLRLIIFDLIKEIMDSTFLPYEVKIKYCNQLLDSAVSEQTLEALLEEEKAMIETHKSTLAPLKTMTSYLLAFAAAIITFGFLNSNSVEALLNAWDMLKLMDFVSIAGLSVILVAILVRYDEKKKK